MLVALNFRGPTSQKIEVSALEPLQLTPASQKGEFNLLERHKIEETPKDPVFDILRQSMTAEVLQVPNRPIELHTFWAPNKTNSFHLMKASRMIQAGEIFVSCPVEDIMNSANPHPDLYSLFHNVTDPKLQAVLWKSSGVPFRTVWLALGLLYHRSLGESSRFFPYIQTLPTQFSTPNAWTPKELEMLNGTSISKCH